MMSHHYTLKLTTKQAALVEKALDFYTRIGMGQWQEFAHVIDLMFMDGSLPTNQSLHKGLRDDDQLVKAIKDAKLVHLGLHPDAAFGISHPELGDNVKVAYDVSAVLRKAIATAQNHKSFSVWHDNPLHLGTEPLSECSYDDKEADADSP